MAAKAKSTKRSKRTAPAKRGRKPTLTPAVRSAILDHVRAGVGGGFLRHAAAKAGVPWSTLTDWVRKGEQGDDPYADFVRELRLAESDYLEGEVEVLLETSDKAIATSMRWLLERRFPDLLGAKSQLQVDLQSNGSPSAVIVLPANGREAPNGGKR